MHLELRRRFGLSHLFLKNNCIFFIFDILYQQQLNMGLEYVENLIRIHLEFDWNTFRIRLEYV